MKFSSVLIVSIFLFIGAFDPMVAHAESISDLRARAERGDAEAQYNLGVMYGWGGAAQNVPHDDKQAAIWYLKAAEQKHAGAQYMLGAAYFNGFGVIQDYTKAIEWYRKSAEQGFVSAQNSLGGMYFNGQGVLQDYTQAAVWYLKAAEQGHADSQNKIGEMYKNGQGVPKDYALAYMWFNLAASHDNKDVLDGITHRESVRNRDTLLIISTPSQIGEGQRLTREWLVAHPQNKDSQ